MFVRFVKVVIIYIVDNIFWLALPVTHNFRTMLKFVRIKVFVLSFCVFFTISSFQIK